MGPAHDGFEFLKGNFEGLKGYVVGQMTKSRCGKIYIDDTGFDAVTSSFPMNSDSLPLPAWPSLHPKEE